MGDVRGDLNIRLLTRKRATCWYWASMRDAWNSFLLISFLLEICNSWGFVSLTAIWKDYIIEATTVTLYTVLHFDQRFFTICALYTDNLIQIRYIQALSTTQLSQLIRVLSAYIGEFHCHPLQTTCLVAFAWKVRLLWWNLSLLLDAYSQVKVLDERTFDITWIL